MISDQLLDQLRDELREVATSLRSRTRSTQTDNMGMDRELAFMLDDLAAERGLLVRFACLLREHASPSSAITAIAAAIRNEAADTGGEK